MPAAASLTYRRNGDFSLPTKAGWKNKKEKQVTMKINLVNCLVPAALLGAVLLPLAAQADSINDRLHDQHQRIHQGVASGQLTRREQHRLNAREASIRRQEYRDRLSGGRFTPRERRHIQGELNRSSRAVYRQTHDGQVR